MIGHLLNRRLQVHRPVPAGDGSGGQAVVFVHVGEVPAKVDQPSARERAEADQWGAEHSHDIYLVPGSDVRRGDVLTGDGQRFRILATAAPSRAVYLKAPASELTQPEGA